MYKSSIIIPTANRGVSIKAAIQSLIAISPDQNGAEIIVVDNNTSEELSVDLHRYCHSFDAPISYHREPSPGLSAARHRGAAEARGDLLTFIDDDVEVTVSWLKAIQNGFADPAVAMIGGPSIPKFTGSIPSWFWHFVEPTPYGGWMCSWLSLLDIGHDIRQINPNYIWGLNFSIRKQVLEACGGFHVDLVPVQYQRWQGDGETGLTMKVQAAGYRADYLQDAMLLHHCGPDRLNVDYFKKRTYFQGVCDSFTHIRRGHQPLPHQRQPNIKRSLHQFKDRIASSMLRCMPSCLKAAIAPWASEGLAVKFLTEQAHLDGWLFHQQQVASDPELLAWVRRENFLDVNVRLQAEAAELSE